MVLKIHLRNYREAYRNWIKADNNKDSNNRLKYRKEMNAYKENYNKSCDKLNYPNLKMR